MKTKGKGVPETKKNKFPTVETYREHIDGRYWFPTYSYADEELIFENGGSLHVRMKVRYSDFTACTSHTQGYGDWGERRADGNVDGRCQASRRWRFEFKSHLAAEACVSGRGEDESKLRVRSRFALLWMKTER